MSLIAEPVLGSQPFSLFENNCCTINPILVSQSNRCPLQYTFCWLYSFKETWLVHLYHTFLKWCPFLIKSKPKYRQLSLVLCVYFWKLSICSKLHPVRVHHDPHDCWLVGTGYSLLPIFSVWCSKVVVLNSWRLNNPFTGATHQVPCISDSYSTHSSSKLQLWSRN